MGDDVVERRKQQIVDSLTKVASKGDGSIDAVTLAEVLSGIDGEPWDSDRVAKLMEGAGGDSSGRITVDALVGWLFKPPGVKKKPPPMSLGGGAEAWTAPVDLGAGDEDCEPCSPKVPVRRKKKEKRAKECTAGTGEQLFCPESHPTGILLIRPEGSFAYVHDGHAKFSEGVQGDWTQEGENTVRLKPTGFGYCYEESFDAQEILSLCPVVTLCKDRSTENGTPLCTLPAEIANVFSWMDPTKQEAEAPAGEEELVEPCSPKVSRKKDGKRAAAEARAHAYVKKEEGEQLCRPKSNLVGLLLLRPEGLFSYVHDSQAKFSEGVQGLWTEMDKNKVKLEPKTLGWCYAGRFDMAELATSVYTITLCPDELDSKGMQMCAFPDEVANKCSWLNPTLDTPRSGVGSEEAAQETEPLSPKIPKRQRRNAEKRGKDYQPGDGEELFCPQSHPLGVLLVRKDNTFAYVHDATARFSEGVQGSWSLAEAGKVVLDPSKFGWCYQESFDAGEIIGIRHTVTLCRDVMGENGKPTCTLSEECCTKCSWLDPSLPE